MAEAAPRVTAVIREEIRALAAYHVPPAQGLVKLDAMENPYTWPPEMVAEWLRLLERVAVNRYPDPGAEALKARLREAMGVPEGAGILLGNGSDEIIQILALAAGGPRRAVVAPEPGFVMYRMIATFCGLGYRGVPLRAEDFALDVGAMRAALREARPALVFLAAPNNPTGNLFDEAALRAVIEAAPGLVVVDEAYAPFADFTAMGWLAEYPHLLVMRTVSKLGLAGLRLGLLAGDPAWIAELEKVRLPYNVNVLTQVSAEFALRHGEVFAAQTAAIRAERARLHGALAAVAGVRVWPSRANFLLFRVPAGRAGEVFEGLRTRGVLVKNLDGSHPLLADCLRVTVGRPEENDAFLAALEAVLGA
ncbi:histidinol-phosphate transaminase [Inmirania thermothiophila]|uniref:Histidinol-phosphate aminotransferase n=1 Tax=Inmirania thermothiophila TaxID=1750597 RepID=A0A3N1XXW7_9GAMM|nr:histidinol-phosphate transaminase [Inmirania thermothiophila]ROR29777.1 histidinol phosphate aminotransferase [Inmirania thermothiophila]